VDFVFIALKCAPLFPSPSPRSLVCPFLLYHDKHATSLVHLSIPPCSFSLPLLATNLEPFLLLSSDPTSNLALLHFFGQTFFFCLLPLFDINGQEISLSLTHGYTVIPSNPSLNAHAFTPKTPRHTNTSPPLSAHAICHACLARPMSPPPFDLSCSEW